MAFENASTSSSSVTGEDPNEPAAIDSATVEPAAGDSADVPAHALREEYAELVDKVRKYRHAYYNENTQLVSCLLYTSDAADDIALV